MITLPKTDIIVPYRVVLAVEWPDARHSVWLSGVRDEVPASWDERFRVHHDVVRDDVTIHIDID